MSVDELSAAAALLEKKYLNAEDPDYFTAYSEFKKLLSGAISGQNDTEESPARDPGSCWTRCKLSDDQAKDAVITRVYGDIKNGLEIYEEVIDTIMSVSDNLKAVDAAKKGDDANNNKFEKLERQISGYAARSAGSKDEGGNADGDAKEDDVGRASGEKNNEVSVSETESNAMPNKEDGEEDSWGFSNMFGDLFKGDGDDESGANEKDDDAWKCIFQTEEGETEGKAFKRITSKVVEQPDGETVEELFGHFCAQLVIDSPMENVMLQGYEVDLWNTFWFFVRNGYTCGESLYRQWNQV